MSWKDETDFKDVHQLLQRLLQLQMNYRPLACRGQPDRASYLIPTLDRLLDPKADYTTRLEIEAAVRDEFRTRTQEHLDENQKRHLGHAMGALGVLQHYGAPTRLLDWTLSPWVALYYATITHHDVDGAVWWFDQEAFEKEVDFRWERDYGLPNPAGEQVDLNGAFTLDAGPWITKYHYYVSFPRIEAQQGFFTVAGRLGIDHACAIADVLQNGGHGRLIVPANLKPQILKELRAMNVHSRSLDYPGADIVGRDLYSELASGRDSTTVTHHPLPPSSL